MKRKAWKLEDVEYRTWFSERVYDLVNTNDQNIWNSFRSGVLKACDEVCGIRKGRAKIALKKLSVLDGRTVQDLVVKIKVEYENVIRKVK